MWMDVQGHDSVVERFRKSFENGRLASTYLFVGPGGVGKRMFAQRLAQALFCSASSDSELTACGTCQNCQLCLAGNHPDLLEIGLLEDKRGLLLEQFIGPKEARHTQGLCHDISLRPYLATRRVAVIDDADTFNAEVANSLLKTLEEPPPHSLLILVGTSLAKQLPTIRSRAQVVRFGPLADDQLADLILQQQIADDASHAQQLATIAGGGLDRARQLAGDVLWELRGQVLGLLGRPVVDGVALGELVFQYTSDAGKEASLRRSALMALIDVLVDEFRSEMRSAPDSPAAIVCARRIDRCLEAEQQIARNAHLQSIVQCWASDLAQLPS